MKKLYDKGEQETKSAFRWNDEEKQASKILKETETK